MAYPWDIKSPIAATSTQISIAREALKKLDVS